MYSTNIFFVGIVVSFLLLVKKDKNRILSIATPFIFAVSIILYAWFGVIMAEFSQPNFFKKIQLSFPYLFVYGILFLYSYNALTTQKIKQLDTTITVIGSIVFAIPTTILLSNIWK